MNITEYKNGFVLGSCTAIAILVIILAFNLTRTPIEKTAREQLQGNLAQLLIANSYDNNPATDFIMINDLALGSVDKLPVYRAKTQGKPTGAVVSTIAPDGYNGPIELLIGFNYEGKIIAVRVTNHRETPGLGDDIDEQRSDWIHAFDYLTPSSMKSIDWDVSKNGGAFDQFTGATITPRAVIHAVHQTAQWYQHNRDKLFVDSAK